MGQVPQEYLEGLAVEDRVRTWQEWSAGWVWPNPDLHVVVDEGGIVVGFVVTSPSRDPDAAGSTGEIPSIYLRRRVWGLGYGRALMAAARRRLQGAGFEDATLWVLDTNARARSFYEAGGWHLDGSAKPAVIGGQDVTELRYRTDLRRRT